VTVERPGVAERSGPLKGIRVIDLGRYIAGPVAATLLAEFGAEVIKVERPGVGDDLRRLGWQKDGASLWWSVEARNKDSITLDVSDPRGRDLLLRLLDSSDVLVENFRPGTLERWNLDPALLQERHPELIVLRTSGYGQTGPWSAKGAFNTAVECLGGLRYLNGEPDRPPARPGIALGDYLGSIFGTIGVLLALYERDGQRSGNGQTVDNALYEAVLRVTEYTVSAYQQLGRIRERVGGGSVGTVPARSFRCRDGRWVGISAANDQMFARLAETMGVPRLADDPRAVNNAARIVNSQWVHEQIEGWCASLPSADVLAELDRANVSACEVYSVDRLVEHEQLLFRGSITTVLDPVLGETLMQNVVPKLTRTPGAIRHAGPTLGSSNDRIFRGELGLDEQHLAELHSAGVI
jgi:formyl-CoA transferase